jgi:hypothetical protein
MVTAVLIIWGSIFALTGLCCIGGMSDGGE